MKFSLSKKLLILLLLSCTTLTFSKTLILNRQRVSVRSQRRVRRSRYLADGVLTRTITIAVLGGRVSLRANTSIRYDMRRKFIMRGKLASRARLKIAGNTINLKANTLVAFHKRGRGLPYVTVAHLAHPHAIRLRNRRLHRFAHSSRIEFKGNIIYGGVLERGGIITCGRHRLPVIGGRYHIPTIKFHAHGGIERVMVSRPTTIVVGGQRIPVMARRYVAFHRNGAVAIIYAGRTFRARVGRRTRPIRRGRRVYFNTAGRIVKVR